MPSQSAVLASQLPESPEILAAYRTIQQAYLQNPADRMAAFDSLAKLHPGQAASVIMHLRARLLAEANSWAEQADVDESSGDETSDDSGSESDSGSYEDEDEDEDAQDLDAQFDQIAQQQAGELAGERASSPESATETTTQTSEIQANQSAVPQTQTFETIVDQDDDMGSLFGGSLDQTSYDFDDLFDEAIDEADKDIDDLFGQSSTNSGFSSDSATPELTSSPTTTTTSPQPVSDTEQVYVVPGPTPTKNIARYLSPPPPPPKAKPVPTLRAPGLALPPPRLAFARPELALPTANPTLPTSGLTLPAPSRGFNPTSFQLERISAAVCEHSLDWTTSTVTPPRLSPNCAGVPAARADSLSSGFQVPTPSNFGVPTAPVSIPPACTANPAYQHPAALPAASSATASPPKKTRTPETRFRCRYGCVNKNDKGYTGPQLRRHMAYTHNLYQSDDKEKLKPCPEGARGCSRLHLETDKCHPCNVANKKDSSPSTWCSSKKEKDANFECRLFDVIAPRDKQEQADTFCYYRNAPFPSDMVVVKAGDDEAELRQVCKKAIENWKPKPLTVSPPKAVSPSKSPLKRARDDSVDVDVAQPPAKLKRNDSGYFSGSTLTPSPPQIPASVSPYGSQATSLVPTPVTGYSQPGGDTPALQNPPAPSPLPDDFVFETPTSNYASPYAPVQNGMGRAPAANTQQLQVPNHLHMARINNDVAHTGLTMPAQQMNLPPFTHMAQLDNRQPGMLTTNTPAYGAAMQSNLQFANPPNRQQVQSSGHIQTMRSAHFHATSHTTGHTAYGPSIQHGMSPASTLRPQQMQPVGRQNMPANTAPMRAHAAPAAAMRSGMQPTQMTPAQPMQNGMHSAPMARPQQMHTLNGYNAPPDMTPMRDCPAPPPALAMHGAMPSMYMPSTQPMSRFESQSGGHLWDPIDLD